MQQTELDRSGFPVSDGKPRRVFNKEVVVWVFRKFRGNKITM